MLHPPGGILCTLPAASFATLFFVFSREWTDTGLAYLVYFLSAYSLLILLCAAPRLLEHIRQSVRSSIPFNQAVSRPEIQRFMADPAYRGRVGLSRSRIVNLLYAAFRLGAAFHFRSAWFLSLGVFHLVLGLLRANLGLAEKRQELRCYRQTAWLLFLLDLFMGGMIVQMVLTGSSFSYPGYGIYLSAMYAFYTLSAAVLHLVKYRKLGSPLLSAAGVLPFVSALMTMLGLQTAMLVRFSPHAEGYRRLMNAITGGFVWGVVIFIAIYMLLHSRKAKKEAHTLHRSESKYFHTAAKMDEALLALLAKKELASITVKEICAEAGVNRSTFYLHYETIGDLLSESIQYMNEQFVSHMQQDPAAFIARLRHCPLEELYLLTPQYLMPYLQYVQMHKYLFKAAIENSAALQVQEAYDALFRHVLSPILERFNIPEQEQPYMTAFYVRGLMAIVTQWLEGDCARPLEQIIAVMQRCVGCSSAHWQASPYRKGKLFCDPAGTCE